MLAYILLGWPMWFAEKRCIPNNSSSLQPFKVSTMCKDDFSVCHTVEHASTHICIRSLRLSHQHSFKMSIFSTTSIRAFCKDLVRSLSKAIACTSNQISFSEHCCFASPYLCPSYLTRMVKLSVIVVITKCRHVKHKRSAPPALLISSLLKKSSRSR